MLTGEVKQQIDQIWNAFWSGGIANPLEMIEQITYLLFLRRLDELQTPEEAKATWLFKPIQRQISPEGIDDRKRPHADFRWSVFKHKEPREMSTVMSDHVFPFLRSLGGDGSTYAHHMKDARFTVPTPALLAKVVDLLDKVPMKDRDTKGNLYEYMLKKIAGAGQNGQFRMPLHIIFGSAEFDVIRPGARIDSRYFNCLVATKDFRLQGSRSMTGSAGQKRVPADFVRRFRMPLPPLPEQRRIAAILDHSNALRAKRRAAIAKPDSLAQSIFIDMFGDPATNPRGWRKGVLRDLIASATHGTSRPSQAESRIPMLCMNNIIYVGRVILDDLKYIQLSLKEYEKYSFQDGDVLINRTNSADLVGKTGVIRNCLPITFAGYLVRLRSNDRGHGEYISAVLNSRYGKRILRGMCKSIVGMANINAQEVQELPCALPPVEMQLQFAARIKKIEELRRPYEESFTKLSHFCTALQYRAFRGEL